MDNEFVHLRDVVMVMTHAQFFKNTNRTRSRIQRTLFDCPWQSSPTEKRQNGGRITAPEGIACYVLLLYKMGTIIRLG